MIKKSKILLPKDIKTHQKKTAGKEMGKIILQSSKKTMNKMAVVSPYISIIL